MAILPTPQGSTGVLNAIKGSLGLFADTNKADGVPENMSAEPENIYQSKLPDQKILELVSNWKKQYNYYYRDIEKGQKISFDYWVGRHRNPDTMSVASANTTESGIISSDNLIFEAIETFLPLATRSNPEPIVTADPSEAGQELARNIKVVLSYEADVQHLRRKLAKTTRNWLLNRIGVLKVVWDPSVGKIKTEVTNPKRMIFDVDGFINENCEFEGDYLGERKKATAELLSQMFPDKKGLLTAKVKGAMATKIEYIEWWYGATDVFYTMDDNVVLGKFKNPNWNYDLEEEIDENGEVMTEGVTAYNHLDKPSYPYRFLAIFSTNEQPHDNTSLVLQNIPQQDKINRRDLQIEKNVDAMNGGLVVSGTAFTEEQAALAANALRRGVAIRVPNGKVGDAVLFPNRPGLPADVYNSQKDARQELRNIFGITGSTAEGINSQETVRGKIMVRQMDSSRIGGGITEFIEQLADSIYNLWVQMIYVYYDEEHFVTAAGNVSGNELIVMKNDRLPELKTLTITVKDGSLIPKDPLTQRNEAIDLWSANALDPRTLYKRLDFPDPDEATNQLILWQMVQKGAIDPKQYLPSFGPTGGAEQMGQPGAAPLPTEQPVTGGPPVNTLNGPEVQGETQPGVSNEGVAQESRQIMGSVPIQ